MVTVEQLYKDFGVLADAKEKAGEHEKEYLSILQGVKSGPNEKRLASQFIARFFKYFPTLAEQAIDAQLDLCEDEDVAIRKQAIKDIPSLCKENPENIPRLSDVLTQLLQSEDSMEISLVQTALISLFKIDAGGALHGVFSQITGSEEEVVRERAIKFLSTKLMSALADLNWNQATEEAFIAEIKKTLADVTGDEFVSFMKILAGLPTMQTVQGRQQLVSIVSDQADLDKEFEASDSDCVDRLMQCIKQALSFFSKNVHSTLFVAYICDHVLPAFSSIQNADEGVDTQLEMLKLLAEMSSYCPDLENMEARVEKIFEKLLEYMPLPPAEGDEENSTSGEEPKLQFSYVECLMFAFHQLCRKCGGFLTGEENAERLKDFRIRLQYFARGVQVYIKQLRMALQGKTGEALKTDENKIKVVALKITSNINTLIKDLFHNPPSYKSVVTLSWKPAMKPQAASAQISGQKRSSITPITFDGDGKKSPGDPKKSREIYHPPSGKFSEKAGQYKEGQGRGGGRGGFRSGGGRGAYRGWRGKRY